VGIFDSSRSTQNTNLYDQTTTVTNQTDQSGGFLTFSEVGGGIGIDASSRDSHDVFDSRSSSTSIANSGNTTLSDSGAIAAGRDVGLGGLKLGGDALTTLERVNADSLTLLGGLVDKSIDASRTLARDSADSTAGLLQQAVEGFGSLARTTSEGESDKITRVVGFALAAVAAMVVLPAIFKGGGKGVLA
jgi:hypothetical protein